MIHRNLNRLSVLCLSAGCMGVAFAQVSQRDFAQNEATQIVSEEQVALFQPPSDDRDDRGDRSDRGDRGDRGRSERGGGTGRSDGDSNSGGDRRDFGGRREGSPPSTPGTPAGKTKSKVRVGRVGPKVNLPPAALPAQYSARDVNKDGQIGMYEWSKTDLSTFIRLDTNRDGFLVPAELAAPGSTAQPAVAGSSAVIVPRSSGGFTPPAAMNGRPMTSVPTAAAAVNAPPADLKTVAAESAFDYLDKDKDGALSQEELERSRNARKLFTDAKLEIQYPFPKQKFVENYVKLSQ